MHVIGVQGDAFSEYYLKRLLPQESRLLPRLDYAGADRAYRSASQLFRYSQRELRGTRQPRVTRRVLVEPLAKLLGWQLGETDAVETLLGEEDGSQPLLIADSTRPIGRLLAVPGEASLDHAPEGLHRRYAPVHTLIRILEREGLTWGILLNAFTLRVVRRSEGFVASHLEFDLDAIAGDLPGSREAFHLLWGLLRQDAWLPAPALLDEVVRLGREHQVEVGSLLGQQVPGAVERLLQGALSHPANQTEIAPFLGAARRELLEHLHAGALRCLYRILFVLYAEARGLLPLDMPAYRDGYALSGSRGLVHRALDPATDPRRNPLAAHGFFEATLRALFALLRAGADLGPEDGVRHMAEGCFTRNRAPQTSRQDSTICTSAMARLPMFFRRSLVSRRATVW